MKDKKDRFKRACDYLKYKSQISNQQDIADKMGASRTNVSSAMNGKTNVLTDRFLERFNEAFEGIFNIEWLKKGRGEMLAIEVHPQVLSGGNYNIQAVNSHVSQINGPSRVAKPPFEDAEAVEICCETGVHEGEPIKFVPVIPPKIAQSPEEDIWAYVNSNRVPRTPVVEQLPVYDTAYRIKSDAMAPRLRAGDYVALRYIGPHPKILNGEVYAVDLKASGLVVRELLNLPEGYRLRARQERYEDDYVTYEDVMGVYEIVGAVIMNI